MTMWKVKRTKVKMVIILVFVLIVLGWSIYTLMYRVRSEWGVKVIEQKRGLFIPLTTNLDNNIKNEMFRMGQFNEPYWRWLPKTITDSRANYQTTSLSVNPSVINNGEVMTVQWTNAPSGPSSWLGLYCPPTIDPHRFIDFWRIQELSNLPHSGSADIKLYNIRENCQFRYFINHTDSNISELVAVSNVVRFVDGKEAPLHGHLALTSDASEMRVMWTSGIRNTPIVQYGPCDNEDGVLEFNVSGMTTTYTSGDMCGPPANLSYHFIHPGYFHDVLMSGLRPNSVYCYRFGSKDKKFSKVNKFRTPLKPGEIVPFKFIVYGDMDISPPPGAELTVKLVHKELKNNGVSFVLHVGDLSYAHGLAYRWDEWMTLVEPLSNIAPYMVTVGNHEQDHVMGGRKDPSHSPGEGFHPVWGNYGSESGGECGVPFHHRFHMPDNGHHNWWYSFDYGLAHFTQMSTEHNYTKGSPQYTWLEQDFKSVDCSVTPWLILSGHRPMYSSQRNPAEKRVIDHLREALEELVHLYRVDLVLAGHFHAYERTCKVYREKCSNDGRIHAMVGSGGCELDSEDTSLGATWSEHFEASYGHGRVTVANQSALHWEFVRNRDEKVTDSVWLYK